MKVKVDGIIFEVMKCKKTIRRTKQVHCCDVSCGNSIHECRYCPLDDLNAHKCEIVKEDK